jgi:hypothetical protein
VRFRAPLQALLRRRPVSHTEVTSGSDELAERRARREDERRVAAALQALGAADPAAGELARHGWEALTWGGGLESVSLFGLVEFLGYHLPVKWAADTPENLAVAVALGDLFERLERPRYADICRSDSLRNVLRAYGERGTGAGLAAYRRLSAASGVEPPDTDLLAWGTVMGLQEACATETVSRALEAAMDTGSLAVGRRGWKATAAALTAATLTDTAHGPDGGSWLAAVHRERLETWTGSRSPARGVLAAAFAQRLAPRLGDGPGLPTVPPDADADGGADRGSGPLRWLLDHAATGAPLTARHALATALVVDFCASFPDQVPYPGRRECDVVEIWTLREMATDLGLTRRSNRSLVLTARGREVRAGGTVALRRAACAALLAGRPGEVAAAEIALLHLVGGAEIECRDLEARVAEALTGEGWSGGQDDRVPLTAQVAMSLLGPLRRRGDLLGFWVRSRDYRTERLTPAGLAAAEGALVLRALAPRSDLR